MRIILKKSSKTSRIDTASVWEERRDLESVSTMIISMIFKTQLHGCEGFLWRMLAERE